MQRNILVGILSACAFSIFSLSGNAFAEKSSDTTAKTISIKNLSNRQSRVVVDLTTLDAKLKDKAGSTTDKNVMDQSNFVNKALGEAKQASDDLAQADKLTKSAGKKKTMDNSSSLTNLTDSGVGAQAIANTSKNTKKMGT